VLKAQPLAGTLAHELTALAQEVTHRARLLGIEVPLGQPAKPHQVRPPARIVAVVAVLEPRILLNVARGTA
jgi:hypothetical protein